MSVRCGGKTKKSSIKLTDNGKKRHLVIAPTTITVGEETKMQQSFSPDASGVLFNDVAKGTEQRKCEVSLKKNVLLQNNLAAWMAISARMLSSK